MIQSCNFLDLGAFGNKFTWFRRGQGNRNIAKRIDRALADNIWRTTFSEAFLENLCRLHFDYVLILLRCGGMIERNANRPFRFQATWATHPDYRAVVRNAWGKGNHSVMHGLHEVKKDSLEFNSKVFDNIFKKKEI
ncbi:hypothetical protein NMG60_11025666 [Bertholletia excelsa]